MVEKFVHDPMQFYGHPKGSLAQVKNPFGDYAPASGAIQGMLKGMYRGLICKWSHLQVVGRRPRRQQRQK